MITVLGRSDSNVREMEVILGERRKGMNEINDLLILNKWRDFRFGSKGSLVVQSCMIEKTSGDGEFRVTRCLSTSILRAYFRKRVQSIVVGSLLKDFRTESLRRGKRDQVGALIVHLPSF